MSGQIVTITLVEVCFGCAIEIVERMGKGFDVQAFRWIVERTFSWFEGFRRLSKDYEMKSSYSEAWVFLAMTKIMLNRLA
jgi:putative transposase